MNGVQVFALAANLVGSGLFFAAALLAAKNERPGSMFAWIFCSIVYLAIGLSRVLP